MAGWHLSRGQALGVMLSSPHGARVIVVVAVVLTAASSANAGPPKGQSLKSVRIDGSQRILANTSVSGQPGIRVVLAQVSAPARFRASPRCRLQSTQTAIARLATEMRLDDAIEITADVRLVPAAYVSRPRDGRFSARQSLNYRLVRRGLGRVTSARGVYRAKFLSAQRAARRSHLGLWSRCRS